MYLIFEVLRLVSAVFGTAIAVQAINKSPPYGHLIPNKEKQLRKSFQIDWPSADSRKAVVSYWPKDVHEVLANR